ncbi:MAG: DUF3341 domain-containing protein [Verrucomicrobiota bacterium]
MSKKSVFCIATSEPQAERIVQRLQASGFPTSDISVLLPDSSAHGDFGHVKSTKASEGIAAGVTTGGVAGGAIGLLAGIGALAIPGLGPFIAAGPIMAALSGAAVGATAGGIVGGLIGLGIPEIEAKRYEDRLNKGNYLISVHAVDGDHADRAKEIFDAEGAEDISTISEEKAPKA